MEFTPNTKQPQTLKFKNIQSSKAIALYLKYHTFMDWKMMMKVWKYGYSHTNKHGVVIDIKVPSRPNGGFWGGGGHGSPNNYETTIQYLLDHGLITFTHINGFKLFSSTKKLKSKLYF